MVRVGAHAWYSYGASSTDKRDVRGSNAVQWAMMRDAIAAGADVYDLRGITPTLDVDDTHVGLVQFKVGTGGEAVEYAGEWDLPLNRPLYEAFDLYMRRVDEPDAHRRRRPLARPPACRSPTPRPAWCRWPRATATASRSAGWPARPRGWGRHPRGRHLRGAARGRRPVRRRAAGAHAVAAVPPAGRRRARRTGRAHGQPARRPHRAPRGAAGAPGSLLELETSMRRHGMTAQQLWATAGTLRRHHGARLEGVALHLPLASGDHLAEVERLLTDVVAAELRTRTIWVSHLTPPELDTLRTSYADLTIRPRIGTDLWLGDRDALRVTSTVLDVHPLRRGDRFGYRGRTAPRERAPAGGQRRHRARHRPRVAEGRRRPEGAGGGRWPAAAWTRPGLARSPFWVDGKQRLFAEPPHMQASMLFLPADARVPEVGDEVDVRVRYTATAFDRVLIG